MTHGGNCIAGSREGVATLAKRNPQSVLRASADPEPRWPLVRPQRGAVVADAGILARAQGCLLGQCAGDALGQLVEFKVGSEIARLYPNGVSEMADGGHFNTLAGQPTDDSELALLLARSIVKAGRYDPESAAQAYAWWLGSRPFDVGNTTRKALLPALEALEAGLSVSRAARESASTESQANGALMRVSPLAVFAWNADPEHAAKWAREDAALTHPDIVCQDANEVFVTAIAHAIKTGLPGKAIHEFACQWASGRGLSHDVRDALQRAAKSAPVCDVKNIGWVLIALQNAFHELLQAPSFEAGVTSTVRRGGDTDTNAAITGALLGAVHGRKGVPAQWRRMVLTCRALADDKHCQHPRPKPVWPVDVMHLAERMLTLSASG